MSRNQSIVGYTYSDDMYCLDCMREIALGWVDVPVRVRREVADEATEDVLAAMAKFLSINRLDEGSFDSGDFPKVVFEDMICQANCGDDSCDHLAAECGHDKCGGCGGRLCEQ